MKMIFLLAGTMLAAMVWVAAVDAGPVNVESQRQQAMEAVHELAGRLGAELKTALKNGGAIHAIDICNTRARMIAEEISRKRKLRIGRVSLKNRNPGNAPGAWEKKVLEDFERQRRSGKSVAELTYAVVVRTGRGRQFRFMKAIPTRSVCITCHGKNIPAAVKKELDKLYPDDRARGFRPGDIRGAFVVTRDL